MASIDWNNAQVWNPLSNSFLPLNSMSKSTSTTSSQNQRALLHNKPAGMFKRNGRSTFEIAPAQYQVDDSGAKAQGRNNDPTSCEDETVLPSVEELWDQISRKGISIGGYRNPEEYLQDLENSVLKTSGSRLNSTHSRLDDSTGDSQGTRDKLTDPSGHELWHDVEEQRSLDEDLCPFPPLEQEGLASTSTLAQDQPHSCHHSSRSSQDQIYQHSIKEPAPHTLPASLPRPQIDQERDQNEASTVKLEELGHGSPLRIRDREEPQEQQQRQEVAAETMREDDDDKEPEQRGEKRQHQGANEETSSNIHRPEDSDRSPKTNGKDAEDDEDDDDDEDPRPAKRRKLAPISTGSAPRLGRIHSLTPSSTTQPDESPSQADHEHPPTLVNNDDYNTPQTSRNSFAAESTTVAEYQEWPFQGFLKCTTIDNRTTYNLEFTLQRTCERPHLLHHSEVLGPVSRGSLAKAKVSHRVVSKRKPGKELTRQQESFLTKMVHNDHTWAEIGRHFPGHTLMSLKENFIKQGGQPRKRGRKAGVRASWYIYENETSTPPPTTRAEIDEAPSQDDHGCLSTLGRAALYFKDFTRSVYNIRSNTSC